MGMLTTFVFFFISWICRYFYFFMEVNLIFILFFSLFFVSSSFTIFTIYFFFLFYSFHTSYFYFSSHVFFPRFRPPFIFVLWYVVRILYLFFVFFFHFLFCFSVHML
jgi:hypothetical protein